MIVIQICSTSQFAVVVGLYLYIILSASCTVDIIDQVELWTPLYTGYIFTPFVKYFTSERLIIGYMFKLKVNWPTFLQAFSVRFTLFCFHACVHSIIPHQHM